MDSPPPKSFDQSWDALFETPDMPAKTSVPRPVKNVTSEWSCGGSET